MQATTRPSEKASDASRTEPESNRDIELIDEQTILRLEDEQTDEPGCRFAAVARSLEHESVPQTQFHLPKTVVAYVDESGQYGIEREFFGHRPDWHEIPRTAVVTDTAVVRELPADHQDAYASILETYETALEDE